MPRTPRILATGLTVASMAALVALPASAEDTVATFEVTAAGGLAIDAPNGDVGTPLDLGSVASGNLSFAPSLGTVTVTDERAALVANWVATATGTDFDLQGAGADPTNDPNQRVAATAITYTAVPNVDLGTGIATPTAGTLLAPVGSTVAYVGSGSNTVSWDPTLTMTLLPTQVAGVYQGTVTHSVS